MSYSAVRFRESSYSIVQAATETFDLRFLLLHSLSHPFNAIQSNLSHLLPLTMFGGAKQFSPDKDIPDLSGKVIIVTGGEQCCLDAVILTANEDDR